MSPSPTPLTLHPFANRSSGIIHVLIECPKGSSNKYDFDETLGCLVLDRPIHSSLVYPGDYGSVPGTLSQDGDPLDAIVLAPSPVVPGCLVRARVVGMLCMKDEDGIDPKLICVPAKDPRVANIQGLKDLPPHCLQELEHFFTRIKDLEANKWAESAGFQDREAALEEVDASRKRLKPHQIPATSIDASPASKISKKGCISGRFHPFHKEHLSYALAALEKVDFLYIGITNPDPTSLALDAASQHRHKLSANPFTFVERSDMIRLALQEARIDPSRFQIVPCPIHNESLLACYIPLDATQLVTSYEEEEWGERKIELLQKAGYSVEVLWKKPSKGITSTRIRDLLRTGSSVDEWVGRSVDQYLSEIPNLIPRLIG